ncbi:hypothetical protein BAMA_02100 [Bacillus manliponensis]|uniref:DUF4868 domain-containing protein n=1 Tax=Bacillus manliponensis TaxID=574376 RepID=A0A073JX87_9BACI|nr:Kiwa anti-phage protein KwaB-like domain-containing protein [Bacillus manliponensis]KEK18890.1 hypothetical protein BAMA_02100 [Bacillus manliponensis]
MTINSKQHMISKILNLKEEEYSNIEINVCLVKKDKQKDEYYFSKSVEVDSKIKEFLRKHIIEQLKSLKTEEEQVFPVQKYNQEFQLNDYLGKFNLAELGNENKTVSKIHLLKKAIVTDSLENIKKAKFQMIKLSYENEKVYFCFYTGIKKSAKTKKLAFFSSNEFRFISEEIIEFGGKLSFFMDEKDIYIIDPRYFEYAFDYTDHIAEISQNNIEEIASMSFFPDDNTRESFKKASSHQLFARSLARIEPETLRNVEKYYHDRIDELKEIKNKRDEIKDASEKEKFDGAIGELKDLIKFIDFSNDTIKFNEGENPKPLLHFFQDKIVTSFLTKEIKVMMAV